MSRVDILYLQSALQTIPIPTEANQIHVLHIPDFLNSNIQPTDIKAKYKVHQVVLKAGYYVINNVRTLRWELEL